MVKIRIPNYWGKIASSQEERDSLAQKFYSSLLSRYPELCEFFKSTDMDHLAQHFFETVNILVSIATTTGLAGILSLRPVLNYFRSISSKCAYSYLGLCTCLWSFIEYFIFTFSNE